MSRIGFVVIGAVAAALFAAQASATVLVANGGFETGDFTSWTVTGDGVGIDSTFPNTGAFDAEFTAASNDSSAGVLSQSISTNPAQTYLLTFAVLDESGLATDDLTVDFGGFSTTINGSAAGPPGNLPSGYTEESFKIPGADITRSSTLLSFSGVVDPTSGSAWNFDDVSLVVSSAVPEPASWTLMIAGIGMLGGALRRRVARLPAAA